MVLMLSRNLTYIFGCYCNFDKTELGDTILKFLEQSANITGNNSESMKQLANMLILLIDQKPISPITEEDFEPEVITDGNRVFKSWRCTRYDYLYKTEDGKYWDDRAVVFKFAGGAESDRMYLYQGDRNSKQEVTLPYYPNARIEIIDKNKIDLIAENTPE